MQRLGGFLITKLKQLHSRSLAQCISEQGIDALVESKERFYLYFGKKIKLLKKN